MIVNPPKNSVTSLITGRNRYKSTHRIDYVKYSEDRLVCVCGWEGYAYDRKERDDKHWPTHRRDAPVVDPETQINGHAYKGSYAQNSRKKKMKVVV